MPALATAITSDISQFGGSLGIVLTANALALLVGSPVAGVRVKIGNLDVATFVGNLVAVGAIGLGTAGCIRRSRKNRSQV